MTACNLFYGNGLPELPTCARAGGTGATVFGYVVNSPEQYSWRTNCCRHTGTGRNVRDWLYVEDHATALTPVAERGHVGGTYKSAAITSAPICTWYRQSATCSIARSPPLVIGVIAREASAEQALGSLKQMLNSQPRYALYQPGGILLAALAQAKAVSASLAEQQFIRGRRLCAAPQHIECCCLRPPRYRHGRAPGKSAASALSRAVQGSSDPPTRAAGNVQAAFAVNRDAQDRPAWK